MKADLPICLCWLSYVETAGYRTSLYFLLGSLKNAVSNIKMEQNIPSSSELLYQWIIIKSRTEIFNFRDKAVKFQIIT